MIRSVPIRTHPYLPYPRLIFQYPDSNLLIRRNSILIFPVFPANCLPTAKNVKK